MTETPLYYRPITELAEDIRTGALSPVALTEAVLARIDELNPTLHAYKVVTHERALAEARGAEAAIKAGQYRGPLHGIPYAAKDLYDVAGMTTGAGCSLLETEPAAADCTVVRKLGEAGMVLLGKTHTVQFAFGGVGINHDVGTPHNPWHAEPHAPGGSSSGTAVAVASGMAPMALGSDTGGSVRIPAALNGISGLKTTVGRIGRTGVFPLSHTLDTVGPLTRTVADCALSYAAMQGHDPGDETTAGQVPHDVQGALNAGVRTLRIAYAETAFWDDCDPEVAAAVREAGEVLASLGAQVSSLPFELAGQVPSGASRAGVIAAEAYVGLRDLVENHHDELDPIVASRIRDGKNLPAPDYIAAIRQWRTLQRQAIDELRDVDALIVPTSPIPPKPLAEIDATPESYATYNAAYLRNTAIGNLLNLCAMSVPCGFTSGGLPLSLMIYCKPFAEDVALRVAQAYQQATDWHLRRPPLDWVG